MSPQKTGGLDRELVRDIVQWDATNWAEALRYWERAIDWRGAARKCLELGAGGGGLSLWLALKGQDVVCSDLNGVGEKALELHDRYRVRPSIRYEAIDALRIPYEGCFDVIVFKSMLGGIGRDDNKARQAAAMSEIRKALRPGGKLLFAENLSGAPFHRWARQSFVAWGKSWRYVSIAEMKEFLMDFASFDLRTTGVMGLFGRTEGQRNALGWIDQACLKALVPPSCRYIAYGVATK